METKYWKCPQCETINSTAACDYCKYVPETILPIDSPGSITQPCLPVFNQAHEAEKNSWFCPICQTVNDDGRSKCRQCGKPRWERKTNAWAAMVGIGIISCVCLLAIPVTGGVFYFRSIPLAVSPRIPTETMAVANSPFPATSTPTILVALSRAYPNPPLDGCVLWSTVTIKDEGKTICVYGLVTDSYKGDVRRFYIRFDEAADSFRFVMMNGLRPSLKVGQCVYQTNTVKVYGSLPFMELTETVSLCDA
jgi:hypothetical protein